jgi:hypothetical protein
MLSDFEPETIATVLGVLRGVETFYDTPRLYKRGKGDCNELVPARLAELWRVGELAAPLLIKDKKPDGGYAYHALIQLPDGSSEDPSLILGMGGPDAASLRHEECVANANRFAKLARGGKDPRAYGFMPLSGKFGDPYAAGAWRGGRS